VRVLVDLRPLKESPPFFRLWLGSGLSAVGTQMTTFAVALQVFQLTHSSAAVGGIGLVAAVPAISVGLLGGSVVDSVDRRKLVLGTSSCLAVVSAAFAAQAFAGTGQLWLLYLLVAVQAAFGAVNAPARRTFLARLLPSDQVHAGAALTMLVGHVSLTAGPALAGVLAAAGGLKFCYLVDVVSFAGALYGVAALPPMPPQGEALRPGLSAFFDGMRFIRANSVLTGALLADLSATVHGMPVALFPAINAHRFGGNPQTLGLLTTALAVGGIIGSTLSGPIGRNARQGRTMLVAGAIWGLGLVGFGFAASLWLTLLCLVCAGTADVISVVSRTTIIQLATPDRFRGRVSAAEFVVGYGGPQLGNFRAGSIGSLTTPSISAVAGGAATFVGAALLALAIPPFWRYRRPAPDNAEAAAEPAAATTPAPGSSIT